MRSWGILLVLLLVSAGCLGGAEVPTPAATAQYAPTCPPGETTEENPGVCVGSLGAREAEGLAEPAAAIHPDDPATVAVGTNTRSFVPRDPSVPPPDPIPLQATALHVTRDGGATWSRPSLPDVRGWHWAGDPTLAFTPDGTLYVGSLVLPTVEALKAYAGQSFEPALAVVVVSTPDLGLTWGSPTVFQDETGLDRPWVSTSADGTVYVTWQHSDPPWTEVAWSEDGGQAWVRQGPRDRIPDCFLQSAVRVVEQGPRLTCVGPEADHWFTRVFALDTATGRADPLASLPSSSGTVYLDTGGPDSLVLFTQPEGEHHREVRVHRSTDGGVTWTTGPDLRKAARVDDDFAWMFMTWGEADPFGGAHVLLAGGQGPDCRRANCSDAAQRHQVAWITADAGDGTLLDQAMLTPLDPARRGGSPRALDGTVQMRVVDDFHAIAFQGEQGFMVWHHDGLLAYTALETLGP